MARGVDRLYLLLGILHPWEDVAAARWAIERGDARSRASALEYLDNVLAGSIRKQVLPVLEDLPLDEKVRRGNVLLSTRPRDVEETFLHLINDDDAVVSAAAIQFVAHERRWSLAGDIEHVLVHRDAADYEVFEAASWALAEHRLPAGELRHLAGAARRVPFDPARPVAMPADPPRLLLVLDGELAVEADGQPAISAKAGDAVGLYETLAGVPLGRTVRAVRAGAALGVAHDDLVDLMGERPELIRQLFRAVFDRRDATAASGARAAATPAGMA